jgi:hypothetical protein
MQQAVDPVITDDDKIDQVKEIYSGTMNRLSRLEAVQKSLLTFMRKSKDQAEINKIKKSLQ